MNQILRIVGGSNKCVVVQKETQLSYNPSEIYFTFDVCGTNATQLLHHPDQVFKLFVILYSTNKSHFSIFRVVVGKIQILVNAMTQRPIPAARYSRLLNQESDEDKKPTALSTPTNQSTLSHQGLIGFCAGTLGTLTIVILSYLVFSQQLSASLCVTPYKQQVDFVSHPEYSNLSSQHDKLWDEILPSNGGFLADSKYGVTMFHQLHCLQLLRIGLQRAHHEDEDGDMVMDSHGHNMQYVGFFHRSIHPVDITQRHAHITKLTAVRIQPITYTAWTICVRYGWLLQKAVA